VLRESIRLRSSLTLVNLLPAGIAMWSPGERASKEAVAPGAATLSGGVTRSDSFKE